MKFIANVKNKLVLSGNVVEVYEYSTGYPTGYTLTDDEKAKRGRKKGEKSDDYEDNREKVISRAKRDLRRLINSNVNAYGDDCTSKFVTLTFRENITDVRSANYEFKKFIQRLNYYMYGVKTSKIQYSVVPEFQKRGAVHYHVIFYNLPYLKADDLSEIWGNGFIKINKIQHVDNVGSYVTKYMSKDASDERLEGEKCHFSSRGLYKPIEFNDVDDKKIVESLRDSLHFKNLKYMSKFSNDYLGTVDYYQFNTNYNNPSIPFDELTLGKYLKSD